MIRSLTLLLLAVVACAPETSDTTGETTDTTTPTTTPTTGEGPTSMTTEGTGTDTGEPTTGEMTSMTTESTGTMAGDGCQVQCNNAAMCPGDPDPECLEGCQGTVKVFEYIGPACVAAFEAQNQCSGALSCEDLAKSESEDYPCLTESQALSTQCVLPECTQLCAKEDACGLLEPEEGALCAYFCSTDIASLWSESGDSCADANRLYTACMGGLKCADLVEGTGCEAELAALEAC